MIFLALLGTVVIYALGVGLTTRILTKYLVKDLEGKKPQLFTTEKEYEYWTDACRDEAITYALAWPVTWVLPLWSRLTRVTVETDRRKRLRAESELAELKKQAKKLGLEFPDVEHSVSSVDH